MKIVKHLILLSIFIAFLSFIIYLYIDDEIFFKEKKNTLNPLSKEKRLSPNFFPIIKRYPDHDFGIVVFDDKLKNDKIITELTKKTEETKKPEVVVSEEVKLIIKKAKEIAELGNRKLATKLFKHALAIDPNSIEVLTNFGEFIEDDNIIQADLFYQKALSFDPLCTTAVDNRKRTAPIVATYDKNIFSEIDSRQAQLYQYSSHNPTLRSAMKEFYYQHIYHTVALEGNGMSLEQIRVVIDHHTAVAGKSIQEHNEVIGLSEALQYLNNSLLMKIGELTLNDVRSIHKRVMGHADPYIAGEFRSSQVFIGHHIPPDPSDVDEFMKGFEDWINSPETLKLHPVEFAALAHYRLVFIHPFLDGNGRTARLLMNFILMRHGIPPVSIEVQDRWVYYETLTQANEGDVRPFVRFIARCTKRTLDEYIRAAQMPYIRIDDKNKELFTTHLSKDKYDEIFN